MRIVGPTIACVLVAGSAHADVPDAHHEIRIDGGLASALGFGGASYTYAPPRTRFGIEAGAGVGYTGLQLSVMAKLYLGSAHDRFVAGVGPSLGLDYFWKGYPTCPGYPTESQCAGTNYWLNLDLVGYEHRWRNGLAFSIAFGAAVGLGGSAEYCWHFIDPGYCAYEAGYGVKLREGVRGHAFPQMRMGVGYWF